MAPYDVICDACGYRGQSPATPALKAAPAERWNASAGR